MKKQLSILAAILGLSFAAAAAVPSAEKILPDDTLVLYTITDFAKVREINASSPQGKLFNDPAMKPFRDKLLGKAQSEYLTPLEHDLGVHFADYTSLPQGQITFALVQDGWQGKEKDDQTPGILFLLDTRDKSAQLSTNLADLKKKWIDAGRSIKTEKIRDVEFSAITLTTNEIPKVFLKKDADTDSDKTGKEDKADKTDNAEKADKTEAKRAPSKPLYIGQADSLLIISDSPKAVEKVLSRIAGGSVKSLGESPAFASSAPMLRDAVVFGWVNTKTLLDFVSHMGEGATDVESENPFAKPGKIISALGLDGLKSAAFNVTYSVGEGSFVKIMLGVPAEGRSGIFKILTGEGKDCRPPAFVPADTMKFERWRIDGQKAWATLHKMVTDFNPGAAAMLDGSLAQFESGAKEKNPNFDIKKDLIGNLGDDIITYQKAPKGTSFAEIAAAPMLYLIGSPNAEQLGDAVRGAVAAFASPPTDREFLGHKIYSLTFPMMPTTGTNTPALSYCAAGGYLALSMDSGILEEYLRNSQNQGKSLKDLPGFDAAAQKVAPSGSSLFGYSNDAESIRTILTAFKSDLSAPGSPFAALSAVGVDSDKIKEWVDFSLLPPFEAFSKYFAYSVFGGKATDTGLTLSFYTPTPPGLKN